MSQLEWLVTELRQQLAQEMDFRREADNAHSLSAAMASEPRVVVPHVYRALSGERVLTMEWVEGCKVCAVPP